MYEKKEQLATTKQLWKLNDVAVEITNLKIAKLKIDGESPKGKGDYLVSTVALPLSKVNAMELIEAMIDLRDSLKTYVGHTEDHGAPEDLHELLGVKKL